jgi:hypothetical protein
MYPAGRVRRNMPAKYIWGNRDFNLTIKSPHSCLGSSRDRALGERGMRLGSPDSSGGEDGLLGGSGLTSLQKAPRAAPTRVIDAWERCASMQLPSFARCSATVDGRLKAALPETLPPPALGECSHAASRVSA